MDLENLYNECHAHMIPISKNIDLKKYTTLHIGGKASLLAKPDSITQIQLLLSLADYYQVKTLILGKGSNVLISDDGFNGLVILLASQFSNIRKTGNHLICESGALLKDICLRALEESLSGLEFAYGIPGSAGGAVYMNAGAYGGEMRDVIESVTYLDEKNELKKIYRNDLMFSYRHSIFSNRNICILEAEYALHEGKKDHIKMKMDDLMEKRKAKQPLEKYSAGSTFKRPQGHYASLLISECGLKGYAINDAKVSEKHAGFLINEHNATYADFMKLINDVQNRVYEQFKVKLECEIKIINS